MDRDYTTLFSAYEATLYADADQAITKLDLWNWLAGFTPKRTEGWMFTTHPNIEKISSEMKLFDAHSGASFAVTLQNMKYIAMVGWPSYVSQVKLRRSSLH